MTQQQNDTVELYLERMKAAWNAGDAHALACEFTEDATFVTFIGEALVGRAEIESAHAEVLGGNLKGTQLIVKPVSIRMIGDNVVVALTVGGIGATNPIKYGQFQTYTLVNLDGRWQCAAFQNTEMSSRSKVAYDTHDSAQRRLSGYSSL
jgi:uncharacterized protein (TIGR02246 family)